MNETSVGGGKDWEREREGKTKKHVERWLKMKQKKTTESEAACRLTQEAAASFLSQAFMVGMSDMKVLSFLCCCSEGPFFQHKTVMNSL